ncbi:MAG: hypothetical protein GX607_15015 [Myxococcales bacterium]|jgi:hypothetical protein|nr:hypothetical protein [Myxococcales bacterium]
MNLSSAAIVLRERTALEVIDLSLRFVRSLAPLAYLRLGAVVLLPIFAGCLLLRYVADVGWAWIWLIAWCAATVAQGPFTLLAGRLLFADEVRARSILVDALRRAFPYAVLLTLRALLFLLSTVIVIGPLLVWSQTAYVHEILYLENATVRTALGRSSRFVRGRSGSSMEMLLLLFCGIFVSIVLAEVLGLMLVRYVLEIALPVETVADNGGSPFALAGLLFAVPFISAQRFLFYVNERTLRDGWDVQVRFLGLREELGRRA